MRLSIVEPISFISAIIPSGMHDPDPYSIFRAASAIRPPRLNLFARRRD
jgi:hypothetical protein